jgi:hypothetical protein
MLTEYEILNYILLKCNKISHSLYQVPLNLYIILYPDDTETLNENQENITINKNRIKRKLKQLVLKEQVNNLCIYLKLQIENDGLNINSTQKELFIINALDLSEVKKIDLEFINATSFSPNNKYIVVYQKKTIENN